MSVWKPIEEAKREPKRILCWMPGYDPLFLTWKTNHRIVEAHKKGEMPEHAEEYFGDETEMDDYHLALPGHGPVLFFDVPDPAPFYKGPRREPTLEDMRDKLIASGFEPEIVIEDNDLCVAYAGRNLCLVSLYEINSVTPSILMNRWAETKRRFDERQARIRGWIA
jgi:hypothetical protein